MSDLDRLRQRGLRAFPDAEPKAVMARVRAVVGSAKDMPPDEEGQRAAAALRKLQGLEGGDPTPQELASLELMIRMMRPAPFVHGGEPDTFRRPDHSALFPEWETFRKALAPLAHCIARIDTAGSLASSETIGTGFLIGEHLLMTNRHVLADITRGTEKMEEGMAVARFQLEEGSFLPDDPRPITGIAAVHESLDVVLLSVEASAPRYFAIANETKDDADVVVAGYPSETSDRNPLFVRSIFGTSLGNLRAAPGNITKVIANGFAHDCSTLGGNSGSPVLRMQTAEVIGLHKGGSFLWNNQAVGGASLLSFVQERAGG